MKQLRIILLLLICLHTITSKAELIDGICYNLTDSGAVVVSGGNYSGDIVIPDRVECSGKQYSVIAIGAQAFRKCYNLTSVQMPNTIKYIYSEAFESDSKLNHVQLSKNLRTIGNRVFKDCTSLESFMLHNSLTSIGMSAFSGCSGLISVTIPNSVTSIGSNAFRDCRALMSVTISNLLTSIEDNTFLYCSSLASVNIPNSVTNIGNWAFEGCSSLTSVSIPNSVEIIGNCAFAGCSSLKTVTIPNSVTSIGSAAFRHDSSVISLTISNSVTSIGDYAFAECSSLTSVTIPNSVTSIGKAAFYGCSGIKSVIIPSSVTSIKDWTFDSCSSLTSLTIPNSVTSIGAGAFKGCTKLTSLTIPNSVTSIGSQTFSDCHSLISIVLPNTITKIDGYMFSGCTEIESITIPETVIAIEEYAFYGCTNLKSIEFPKLVSTIKKYSFDGCSRLKSVIFGSSMTSIGERAFAGCKGLTSITIPHSVTSIGKYAFYDCTSLNRVLVKPTNPPVLSQKEFSANCLITVPYGSYELYSQDIYWKEMNLREEYAADDYIDGHGYVDLGLPSKTLWSICNLNANKVHESGNYYSWGELSGLDEGKTNYSWKDYIWCNGTYSQLLKYNSNKNYGYTDNKMELDLTDDAAYVYWGKNWIMPTKTQFEELIENCEFLTVNYSNTTLYVFKSKINGKSIAFPSSGYCDEKNIEYKDLGYCWSNTLASSTFCEDANAIKFESNKTQTSSMRRNIGLPIRPVVNKLLVKSLTINESDINLNVGETQKITPIIFPNEAKNKKLNWKSLNTQIATVDEGMVSAKAPGQTTIIAETTDGSSLSSYCTVTVRNVSISSIKLNKESTNMVIGDSYSLTAEIQPENATNKNLHWESSNPAIVSVDNGRLTAKGAGNATITVKATDGSNIQTTCTISVSKKTQSIIWEQELTDLTAGGELLELKATSTSGLPITYTSLDENVAAVFDMGSTKYLNVVSPGHTKLMAEQLGNNIYEACTMEKDVIVAKADIINDASSARDKYEIYTIEGIKIGVFSHQEYKRMMNNASLPNGIYIINGRIVNISKK